MDIINGIIIDLNIDMGFQLHSSLFFHISFILSIKK